MLNFYKKCAFLLIALHTLSIESQELKPFKCPLYWSPTVEGVSLPNNAVLSDPVKKVAIVRAVSEDNDEETSNIFYGGRIDTSDLGGGQGWVILGHKSVGNYSNFQVLTNPHDCATSWVKSPGDVELLVHFDDGKSRMVGRAELSQTSGFFSGQLYNRGSIEIVNEGLGYQLVSGASIEYLTSYSRGLTLEVTEFRFGNDKPFQGSKDVIGMDTIINGGDTEIRQTIYHRKKIVESVTVSTKTFSSFTFSATLSIKADLKMDYGLIGDDEDDYLAVNLTGVTPAFNIRYDYSKEKTRQEDFHSHRETDVAITREAIVPPHTAVQICSIINTQEDFTVEYTAKGRYSAPGLDGTEIQALLATEGKAGIIEENAFIVEETGYLSGTLFLMTQFIAVPIEVSSGGGGCSTISNAITELKRMKALSKLRGKGNDFSNNNNNEFIISNNANKTMDIYKKEKDIKNYILKLASGKHC